MLSFLRGYAVAVLEDAASESSADGSPPVGVEVVAGDLMHVSEVMSNTPSLDQVMTDDTVPTAARRAVAGDLLASRIVPPALRIVERAILIERADNLLPALGDLAEQALLFFDLGPDQFEVEEPVLGRIGTRNFASGYAAAVLEDVRNVADLEEIEQELFAFARAVESNDRLRAALADSSRPLGDRRKLISDLLGGRSNPVTVRLARAAVHGRSRGPAGALEWMAERVAEARGWRVARVMTAPRYRRGRAHSARQCARGAHRQSGRAVRDRGRRVAWRSGHHRREPARGRKRTTQTRPALRGAARLGLPRNGDELTDATSNGS